MMKGTLSDAMAWNDPGVYLVRRCLKCPPAYVGSTRNVGQRLHRHKSDGSSQECSKLSGPMRRAWPTCLREWWVELWAPEEIGRKYAPRSKHELSLREAEVALQRALRPSLNSIDGSRPDPSPEQLALL